MSKVLNLNDIETRALINVLKLNEAAWNKYDNEGFRIARITGLAVIQSVLVKLGAEVEDLKDSVSS